VKAPSSLIGAYEPRKVEPNLAQAAHTMACADVAYELLRNTLAGMKPYQPDYKSVHTAAVAAGREQERCHKEYRKVVEYWAAKRVHTDAMNEAAFEALENDRPFSSTETRLVRYHGSDRAVCEMQMAQMNRACMWRVAEAVRELGFERISPESLEALGEELGRGNYGHVRGSYNIVMNGFRQLLG
jgi:hypothetical protein